MPATTPTSAAIRLPAAIPWWPSPVRARHHHGRPAGRTYQPQGGWLGFGPHGQLYIPLDDSGGGGDPDGNAQNPQSLLGKILRLDVGADAFPGDAAHSYTIPSDNPFVGTAGVAPEIGVLGLRNPFRASSIATSGLSSSVTSAKICSRKSISARRAPTTAGTTSKGRRASSLARWDRVRSPTRSVPTAAASARP